MLHLYHENRRGVDRHPVVQVLRRGTFEHHDGILVEHVAPEQRHGFVGIARNDRADHAVHPLEIHGPLAAVQKVVDLGFGRIVGALADHLLERVHQVIPVRLVDIARHADHVAVFTQIADMAAQLHLRHEVDVETVDRRRSDREVVRIADVPQHVFDFGGGTVGIEQGVDFFDEFAAAVTQFERFRIAVRNEHQRNVRITRNILPELQQVTVDLGLLFGRIVGLLHAKAHETREVIKNVARQKNLRPRPQRFIKIQELQCFVAQKCFRFTYNFHLSDSIRFMPFVPGDLLSL